MTFKLVEQYTFKRTVEVRRPSENQKDKVETDTFTGVFRVIPPEELEAVEDRLAESRSPKQSIAILIDLAVQVMTGWEDVADAGGKEALFTEEAFRHHLRVPWFRDGVIAAYRASMRGEEFRLGN